MSRRAGIGMASALFGQCQTAAEVEAGRLVSKTAADQWHAMCRGAITRPPTGGKPQPDALCSCPCHEGKERRPMAPAAASRAKATVESGRRDGTLLAKWGEALRKDGTLTVALEPEWTDKQRIAVRNRLHTAARKQSLKIKTTTTEDQITATVRGYDAKEAKSA